MHRRTRLLILLLGCLFLLASLGCGGKNKDEKASEEEFRIPDSLLSPLDSYELTVDEYHPIRGGVMGNEEIELHYPSSQTARFLAVKTFGYARSAYMMVTEKIGKPVEGKLVLIGTKDLNEYKFLTRKEWWYYGLIQGDTIYFEPLEIMIKRRISEIAIKQKIAQVALRRRSGGRIPLWLREAIASYVAEEREILEMQAEQFRYEGLDLNPPPEEVIKDITDASDFRRTRIAFYAAYRMMENLINLYSMADISDFIDRLGAGSQLDEASNEVFGTDYGSLLDKIRVDVGGEKPGGKVSKQ